MDVVKTLSRLEWHLDLQGLRCPKAPAIADPIRSPLLSVKEKAHKHKQNFPVTARVGGGGSPDRVARRLPTGGQGSKAYVLCAEPKEHEHFRPGTRPGGLGTWPGGSVTGVTEKLFMCQMFMCLFRPLYSGK